MSAPFRLWVCPCCNRGIAHPPPCHKFAGRREGAGSARHDWTTWADALIALCLGLLGIALGHWAPVLGATVFAAGIALGLASWATGRGSA